MAKYQITREKYTRYDGGGIVTSTFTADSDAEALVKVCDNCLYSYEDENGNELGDEGFIMPSVEKMLQKIESENGDGADYILKIENLETKEVLFEGEEYDVEEVEW